jgi:hypothetical protein
VIVRESENVNICFVNIHVPDAQKCGEKNIDHADLLLQLGDCLDTFWQAHAWSAMFWCGDLNTELPTGSLLCGPAVFRQLANGSVHRFAGFCG